MKPFILAVIVAPLFFWGCKKVQPEIDDPKDVCACLEEQRSTFFMGEKFGDLRIDLDTIIMPVYYADGDPANFDSINDTYVYFESNYEGALSYEWQVGSNPTTQNAQSFGLYFNGDYQIPVRLILTTEPNTDCFPNDDGIDTIQRILRITNVTPSPLWGEYYGYSTENPYEFFTIEIDTMTRYFSFFTPPNVCHEVIKNLPNGKINPIAFNRNFGSSSYCFEGLGDTYAPYNDIVYVGQPSSFFPEQSRGIYDREKNELRITYYTKEIIDQWTLGGDWVEKTFVGKKL
jgi:hypothetical protein